MWLIYWNILEPTEEEMMMLDVAPVKVLVYSSEFVGIRLEPDGSFDEEDLFILNAIYSNGCHVLGWEVSFVQ